jgi:hypothetical protein
MASINELLGVEPSNFHRRVTVGVLTSVIGAIVIILVILYSQNLFTYSISYTTTSIVKTTSTLQSITFFLVFLYIVFLSSLLYYVYLPWRKIPKEE